MWFWGLLDCIYLFVVVIEASGCVFVVMEFWVGDGGLGARRWKCDLLPQFLVGGLDVLETITRSRNH